MGQAGNIKEATQCFVDGQTVGKQSSHEDGNDDYVDSDYDGDDDDHRNDDDDDDMTAIVMMKSSGWVSQTSKFGGRLESGIREANYTLVVMIVMVLMMILPSHFYILG